MLKYIWILLVVVYAKAKEYNIKISTLNNGGTDAGIQLNLIGTLTTTTLQRIDNLANFKQNGIQSFTLDVTKDLGDVIGIQLGITGVNIQWNVENVIVTDEEDIVFTINRILIVGLESFNRPAPKLINAGITATSSNAILTSTQTFDEDVTLSFTAIATKQNTTLDLSYAWYHRIHTGADAVFSSNTSLLEIKLLKRENVGFYFCVMKVEESIVKTNELDVAINFLTMLPLSIQLTSTSIIEEGNNMDITCSAISNFQLAYTWKAVNPTEILNSVNNRISFNPVTRSHSGKYTCEVSAGNFIKSSTIEVNVNYLDSPTINGAFQTGAVLNYSNTNVNNLQCNATGYPTDFTYTFLFNGESVTSVSNGVAYAQASGNYTCIAKNLYYEKRYTVDVIASLAPLPTKKAVASANTDDEEFWTRDMIIIVVLAIVLFFVVVFAIIIICYCRRHTKTVYYSDDNHRASDKIDEFQFVANISQAPAEGVLYNSNYNGTLDSRYSTNTSRMIADNSLPPAIIINDDTINNSNEEENTKNETDDDPEEERKFNFSSSLEYKSSENGTREKPRDLPENVTYAKVNKKQIFQEKREEEIVKIKEGEKKKKKRRSKSSRPHFHDIVEEGESSKTGTNNSRVSKKSRSTEDENVKTNENNNLKTVKPSIRPYEDIDNFSKPKAVVNGTSNEGFHKMDFEYI